jgi:hypothetical protein
VLLYRKAAQLRIRRSAAPESPFWAATAVSPYGGRRGAPVAIDYLLQRASAAERMDVPVCADVRDELERARELLDPVLVESSGAAERVFRRGEEVLAFCASQNRAATQLVSSDGALPARQYGSCLTAIAAWPFSLSRLEPLFAEAEEKKLRWGVAVPVLYPVTTDLDALEQLADAAAARSAEFLAPIPIETDPAARQALAADLNLSTDDDRYAMLFHSDVTPIQLATERHLAALAAERSLADFVTPPRWDERSNWNAATLLTLVATRMLAMELDLDLAGTLARDGRTVAALDKPVRRIAEAASLAIVESLDETSVDMLTEWLDSGDSAFATYINDQWRVRRDLGA